MGQTLALGFWGLHSSRNVLALPPSGMVHSRRVVAGDTHWDDTHTSHALGSVSTGLCLTYPRAKLSSPAHK